MDKWVIDRVGTLTAGESGGRSISYSVTDSDAV